MLRSRVNALPERSDMTTATTHDAANATLYLRNCWYVAGWAREVQRLAMFRRLILGEPVVLFRKSDGAPVALEDRCAHRHAPLSMGRLRGDNVECAYHGLVFAPDGACVKIPDQDTIPPTACVRSYPVVERHQWIWIWMGDPAKADDSLIPDFHWMEDDGFAWRGETLHVEGTYTLVVENLMDLSHLPNLHLTTLADTAVPVNEDFPVRYDADGDDLHVRRWIRDVSPPPYFRLLGGYERDARVDRWMDTHFTPPAFVRIDIGLTPAGSGEMEGDRADVKTAMNLNAITPETAKTSHYFWAQAQNFSEGDQSISEVDFRLVHDAFQEDLAIIRGQQENIDLAPDAPRLNLAADKGGLQATRIIEKLIRAEAAAATA